MTAADEACAEAVRRYPPMTANWNTPAQDGEAAERREAFESGAEWQSSHGVEMTERQAKAWPEYVAEAREFAPGIRDTGYGWVMDWRDEIRPGRGNDLNALWSDGEHFAQISLDVYGHGTVSVAETHWLHNSADEECAENNGCARCARENDDENEMCERCSGTGLGQRDGGSCAACHGTGIAGYIEQTGAE